MKILFPLFREPCDDHSFLYITVTSIVHFIGNVRLPAFIFADGINTKSQRGLIQDFLQF